MSKITKTRLCSICKSPGVTKSTCPLNKDAKHKNTKGHINATQKIKDYLKRKNQLQKSKPTQIKQRPAPARSTRPTHIKQRTRPTLPTRPTRPTTKINPPKSESYCSIVYPKIIVLDNDECLGQFGLFSSLYVYARNTRDPYKIDLQELRNACVKYLFPYGVARPRLLELFMLLKKLKKSGKLDGVVMYTSAPNNLTDGRGGYVHFLKDCIEQYCNCQGIYDKILHRNNVVAKVSSCGATIKDMGNALLTSCQRKQLMNNTYTKEKRKISTYVNNYTKHMLMIDDKPNNIRCRSGKVMGVTSYEFEGNSKIFKKCIDSVKNFKQKLESYRDPDNQQMSVYDGILQEADENYKTYYGHKNNTDLVKIIHNIYNIYK
jgi:hypothetical protein